MKAYSAGWNLIAFIWFTLLHRKAYSKWIKMYYAMDPLLWLHFYSMHDLYI